ncbi:hypothetical protein [Halomicrobium urmianum]|uniref:hypothetical protein n=1 Tax=Halomicrobium urmianum TaxID=1586233 RepID=UPI001CDA04B8|nr:hypothetical protein [Halomicrobium urmianum]
MDGDSDHASVGNSRLHSATCRDCGKRISDRTVRCPACGVRRRASPKSSLLAPIESNAVIVACCLSAFFPGLGHLSLREFGRGAGFALAGALVLAVPFAAGFASVFAIPVAFALWLSALYDAYTRADGAAAGK